MRSVEGKPIALVGGLLGALLLLAACGSTPVPADSGADARRSASAAATPGAATSAPTAATAKPAEPAVPPAVQRAYDDARRAMRAGRHAEAERAFKAMVQRHPELGGPHANLGVLYRQDGRLAESAAALEQAVKLNPQQPAFHHQLGITYRHQGQFVKAREAYEQALALKPDDAEVVLNLAILHDIYLWDGPRALELYARYLVLTPAGDANVVRWVADLKNRQAAAATASARKEQP